jgi:hypothetical protein
MAMTLQQAIDTAVARIRDNTYGIEVSITFSMHDDEQAVFVGNAYGLSDVFRPDLPLLNLGGTATLAGGGATATGAHGRFRKGPAPGFSTRGLGPGQGENANMRDVTPGGVGPGNFIPIDFSVRKDPGIPWLSFLGMGPSVQIEIETITAAGGTPTGGVKLDVVEDGALLRAVGPSLQDTARRASYTATILVYDRIP